MVWRAVFAGDEHIATLWEHCGRWSWQPSPVLLVLADFRDLWLFLVALGYADAQET